MRAAGTGRIGRGVRLVELVIDMGVAVVRQARPVGVEELLLHAADGEEPESNLTGYWRSAIYRDFVYDVVFGGSAPRGAHPTALVVLFGALAENIIGRPRPVGECGEGGGKGAAVPVYGL